VEIHLLLCCGYCEHQQCFLIILNKDHLSFCMGLHSLCTGQLEAGGGALSSDVKTKGSLPLKAQTGLEASLNLPLGRQGWEEGLCPGDYGSA
jgi:hypothetical protein